MTTRSRDLPAPERVVVIGASLAGLFAAAAAASQSRTVTIVERDVLPTSAEPRPGVAQGRQPHVFLYRGLLALEELLPGLRRDLLEHGAVPVNTGDLPWYADVGWTGIGQRGLEILSASRPLFEHVAAARVRALPGVRVVDGTRVRGLSQAGPEQSARWIVDVDGGDPLEADLVIDASGRGSRLPTWLAALGIDVPAPSEVDARAGYATRVYQAEPEDSGFPGVVVMATPDTRAGGMALRVEHDRYLVLASGYGDRRPPRDVAGFVSHIGSLADPAVSDLIAARRPLGEVLVYRQTGNRRQRYERIADWPEGLLVMGDALCAFNPVYGQGITVAAIEAQALWRELDRGFVMASSAGGAVSSRRSSTRRLMRAFSSAVDLPWSIATGADASYVPSAAPLSRSQSALGWWVGVVSRLATHGDERAAYSLTRLYHLTASPAVLMHPALMVSAVRARLLGLGPPAQRPTGMPGSSSGAPNRWAAGEIPDAGGSGPVSDQPA